MKRIWPGEMPRAAIWQVSGERTEVRELTDANWIFDKAIQLMDEQCDHTGRTATGDTAAYRLRTLGILNVLRHELYPYAHSRQPGTTCPELKSFEQPLLLDDALAQTVLPYGLAAHLLLGENDAMASFFFQRYAELLYAVGCRSGAVWEDIPT